MFSAVFLLDIIGGLLLEVEVLKKGFESKDFILP